MKSWPKSAAVKDIDIDISGILGQKYRYRIDIGKGEYRVVHKNILNFIVQLSKRRYALINASTFLNRLKSRTFHIENFYTLILA